MRAVQLIILVGISALELGCLDERCPGVTECGDTCADLATSPQHCGACDHACAQGQACAAGACVDLGCSDECPAPGTISCAGAPQNGILVCADFVDNDACLEWGGFSPCADGQTCVDGACAGGCQDACAVEGLRVCDGDAYRDCGQHDGDPCLDWSDLVPCGSGETCSSGACSGSCVDECDEGERRCEQGGVKTCGLFDADSCRDWSAIEPCGDGESCRAGECQSSQCLDEGEDCVCGEDQCCEGHCCPVLFICVSFDPEGDFCPFGEGPNG